MLDASVALTWAFHDERSQRGDALFALASRSIVWTPGLFLTETANALLSAEKRKRISQPQIALFLQTLNDLRPQMSLVDQASVNRALTLARTHSLTVYDATYLDLAIETKLPLATFDQQLANAAQLAGVTLL